MWADSVIEYDIIVETLTGNEIEVTINRRQTIAFIKFHIQKYEGIPFRQQHLIYQSAELKDSAEVKDVPLAQGSRLKLVVGLKGGPVLAQRRLIKMPDLESLFDFNAARQDQYTISSPVVKLLLYKDSKRNMLREKMRNDGNNPSKSIPEDAVDLSIDVNDMEKIHQFNTQPVLEKHHVDCKTNSTFRVSDESKEICSLYENHAPSRNRTIYDGTAIDRSADEAKNPFRLESDECQTLSTAISTKHMLIEPTMSKKRSEEIIWQTKLLNNTKSRRKPTKSNWIQNIVGIMRNSKTQELNDIKKTFRSMKESLDASSSTESERLPHSIISNETHRSKSCVIRRNRCLSAIESNDYANDSWHSRYSAYPSRREDEKVLHATSAKAIADSSSFRVFKMSTDSKIKSLHPGEAESFPLRCDSPASWEQLPVQSSTILKATKCIGPRSKKEDSVELNQQLHNYRNEFSFNDHLLADQILGTSHVKNENIHQNNSCGNLQKLESSNDKSNDFFTNQSSESPVKYVQDIKNTCQLNNRCLETRNKKIWGNTNYGYADVDLISKNLNNGPLSRGNSLQEWRCSTSFDDELKNETESIDYSYSNWAYDGKEATTNWKSDLTYQSYDSFRKFDSTVDNVLLSIIDSSLQYDQINEVENSSSMNNDLSVLKDSQLICLINKVSVKSDETNDVKNEKLAKTNVQTMSVDSPNDNDNMNLSQVFDLSYDENIESKASSDIFRCSKCNKKLGIIMIMKCHCEKFFCAKHRYAETHDCSYDFKKNGQLTIAEENPMIVSTKIFKI